MAWNWDRGSAGKLLLLYPDVAAAADELAAQIFGKWGKNIRITEGFRSYAYQNALYAKGRTVAGAIVTWARGGQSFHNFGVAFDICFVGADPWLDRDREGSAIWASLEGLSGAVGLSWGGAFPKGKTDRPHFEKTYDLTEELMNGLVLEGGVNRLWSRLDTIRGVPVGQGWSDHQLPDPAIQKEGSV